MMPELVLLSMRNGEESLSNFSKEWTLPPPKGLEFDMPIPSSKEVCIFILERFYFLLSFKVSTFGIGCQEAALLS